MQSVSDTIFQGIDMYVLGIRKLHQQLADDELGEQEAFCYCLPQAYRANQLGHVLMHECLHEVEQGYEIIFR